MFKKLKRIINISKSSIKGNGNIVITNGYIKNGKETITFGKEREITVIIEGDCKNLDVDTGSVEVKGNVNGDLDVDTGSVKVGGDIKGDVDIDTGSIKVEGSVGGSCNTDCGSINIKNKK